MAPGSLVFCSLQEAARKCAQGDSVEVMCSRASGVNVLVGGTVWIHVLKNNTPVISQDWVAVECKNLSLKM